jgi:hypothetical protein
LHGFSEEQAAKGLILIDMPRCPKKSLSAQMGKMTGWFYNHLARLMYVEACHVKPMHVGQLQQYIDHSRRAHYVDGDYGEYIFPNRELFSRQSTLYADMAAYEDGKLFWSAPKESYGVIGIRFLLSPAFEILEALSVAGALRPEGARIVADVWGQVDFRNTEGWEEKERLTREMVQRLEAKNLIDPSITPQHGGRLYDAWQLPMSTST